jgi:hypothetical protein
MATKKKQQNRQKEPLVSPETLMAIQEDVGALYAEHETEIRKVMDEAEKPVVIVNFTVKLDLTESAPIVETMIRFTSSVTDKRVRKLDDPTQPLLLSKEDLEATKRKPGRPKKVVGEDPEAPATPEGE